MSPFLGGCWCVLLDGECYASGFGSEQAAWEYVAWTELDLACQRTGQRVSVVEVS